MNLPKPDRFESLVSKFNTIEPILVVGDVGIDKYTYGDVKRISPEAPVPVLEVSKEWNKLGLAANVSDNLMSLTVASTLAGVVGEDTRANLMETLLEERGLKTWGIVRDSSRMTTYKERVTTATQQICRVDYESKHALSDEVAGRFKKRLSEFSTNHSGVIIEDYGKGLFSQELLNYITGHFTEAKKMVAVDPSRNTPPLWYKGAHLLKPNLTEAHLMIEALGYFKERNLETIAKALVEKLNLKKIIITLGPDGMSMLDTELDGKLHIIPTAASEVYDVSGAGDTAISAITASLLSGATLEEAAWIGNCASGVVVSKRGTALCSVVELKEYYQKLTQKLKR
jgi:rfaE bifunctional protein kinase chain/domain